MQKKWMIAIPLILVLLALCAVMVVVSLFALRGVRLSGFSLPVVANSMNFSAEEVEESQYTVSGPAQLSVDNAVGKVRVEKGTGKTITIESTKIARGLTQQVATANLDRMEVIITQQEDAVMVRVEMNQIEANWNGQVDFVIRVPEETAVKISSDSGDLFLAGTRGAVDLTTHFGAVTVSDVGKGRLNVNTRSGTVEVSAVQAGSQAVELRSSFGDITLRDAKAGEVTVKSNSGKLTIEGVEAGSTMNLGSDFGRVNVEDSSAASLTVKTQNGEIALGQMVVTGQVSANSDFGPIRLVDVQAGGYDLGTMNGGVRIEDAVGSITARSDFGDIVVENARDATLDLRSKNGAVRFDGSLGAGPHNLHSDFGAIQVRLPAETALNLDLKTSFGKIQTDFEVSMRGSIEKEHLIGKINGGGDLLTATTKNGNITVETLR